MTYDEAVAWMASNTVGSIVADVYDAMQAEIERMREEHDRLYKHGVSWSTGKTVYGTEAACKELGERLEELRRYQQQESRTASALERIAAVLDERLPPIEDAETVRVLQARCLKLAGEKAEVEHEVKALKENQDKLIAKIGELREKNNQLRLSLPDLGVRCRDCGAVITGIGSIAGARLCLICYQKPTLATATPWVPPDAPGDG